MKALILFGSPHKNGGTASLVERFAQNFNGEVEIIYLYPHLMDNGINPCIDCCGCKNQVGCVIPDDFNKILKDDYDVLVIASPIYMSNLPPVLWSVISRFNFGFYNKMGLKSTIAFKEKVGIVLFTAGGFPSKLLMENSNDYLPLKQCKYIFSKTNAIFDESKDYIIANNTEAIPVKDNIEILEKVEKLAKSLSV